jgi:hypothetical protein
MRATRAVTAGTAKTPRRSSAAYGIVNAMSYRWLTVFLDFPADAFDSGVA